MDLRNYIIGLSNLLRLRYYALKWCEVIEFGDVEFHEHHLRYVPQLNQAVYLN